MLCLIHEHIDLVQKTINIVPFFCNLIDQTRVAFEYKTMCRLDRPSLEDIVY